MNFVHERFSFVIAMNYSVVFQCIRPYQNRMMAQDRPSFLEIMLRGTFSVKIKFDCLNYPLLRSFLVENQGVLHKIQQHGYLTSKTMLRCDSPFKGTNLALKKSSNLPEIYAKVFGRFH